MHYINFIKYPLLPILIPQGIWAKIRTPRLNEASGSRAGIIGEGKRIKLLILGDSAAAGVGVDYQEQALAGKICNDFDCAKYQLDWQLHAKNGNTLLDLKNKILELPTQSFDIVIISSGVNDILKQHNLTQWQTNTENLYELIQNKFASPHVLFTQIPPLQHFSALPRLLAWYLGQWASLFDQKIKQLSQTHENLHHIKLTLPPQKEYLARDGFHPSELSYKIWANTLLNYINREQLL